MKTGCNSGPLNRSVDGMANEMAAAMMDVLRIHARARGVADRDEIPPDVMLSGLRVLFNVVTREINHYKAEAR